MHLTTKFGQKTISFGILCGISTMNLKSVCEINILYALMTNTPFPYAGLFTERVEILRKQMDAYVTSKLLNIFHVRMFFLFSRT